MKDTIRNKLAAALAALLLCSALVGCGTKTASAGNASWGNASWGNASAGNAYRYASAGNPRG